MYKIATSNNAFKVIIFTYWIVLTMESDIIFSVLQNKKCPANLLPGIIKKIVALLA
jgi:hypothetical protein